ncbi:MAG TPA: HEAT repeat domain-containing protein [Methanothrix sp.]|nr:HEAT repeat domain-containing protein [Methanothrix sp.]HPT36698.1 HEAT repeat domain-containing protein [Methanothrix sp.]
MIDQAETYRKANNSKTEGRKEDTESFVPGIPNISHQVRAWQHFHKTSQDKDSKKRLIAAFSLDSNLFPYIPDKVLAWKDLIRLIQDKDHDVRSAAAHSLGSAYPHVHDKGQAWQDLHKLTQDEDNDIRRNAVASLRSAYPHIPDNVQAGQDLHRLTEDEDNGVRFEAAYSLGSAYPHIPDKIQAWEDLHRLTQDGNNGVRYGAARSLGSAYPHIPDKIQAWKDLHRLTQDGNNGVRYGAALSMASAYRNVPDKVQAWQDLHRLTQDMDRDVRFAAALSLGSAYRNVTDKVQAWQDLHKLTQDEDSIVRGTTVSSLLSAYPNIPDKGQAWQDLVKLTHDTDSNVRRSAVSSLGSAYPNVTDKVQAWQDLHKLTQDEENDVRRNAVSSLRSAYPHVPDKVLAWQDLHRLTQDEDSSVRFEVAYSLGSAYPHVPDKVLAWQDLHRLTQDEDRRIRMFSYHSLGKASVYEATESEDINALRRHLEAALGYFEISSQESEYSPARFCHPFYRSYFALTFQEDSQDAVQKYLAEAKEAVDGSKSKNELIKAIENLARALQEAKSLKRKSVEEIAEKLNAYSWYCNKAADHMVAAVESAPGTIKLMKKCNLLLEERIQADIEEIQKKAEQICQIAHGTGTEYEAPGAEIYQEAKFLSLDDPIKAYQYSTKMTYTLRALYKILPEGMGQSANETLEDIERSEDLSYILENMNKLITNAYPLIEIALNFKANLNDAKKEIIEANAKQHFETRAKIEYIDECLMSNYDLIVKYIDLLNQQDPQLNALEQSLGQIIFVLDRLTNDVSQMQVVKEAKSALEDPKLSWKLKLEASQPLISIIGLPAIKGAGEIEVSGGVNLRIAKDNLIKACDELAQRFIRQ